MDKGGHRGPPIIPSEEVKSTKAARVAGSSMIMVKGNQMMAGKGWNIGMVLKIENAIIKTPVS
jgi:hypothetical protein